MEDPQQWYRITIPQGAKYQRGWLLSTLQGACILHFTPLDFQFCNPQARFYLQGEDVANVLQQLNHRIPDEEGKLITIIVEKCGAPPSLRKVFEDFPQMDNSATSKKDDMLGPEAQWYRVTILNGSWYDPGWLLFVIQRFSGVSFTPSGFHFKGMKARFFVQGQGVAAAIQRASGTIVDTNGLLLTFLVEPC